MSNIRSATRALEALVIEATEEQREGALLRDACDAIARWEGDAFERLLFQEGVIRAGAYVWRRIARPLVDAKWSTPERREFAEEVVAMARALRRQQGAERYARMPMAEIRDLEARAKGVRECWLVVRPSFAEDLERKKDAAKKALEALAGA